ncbi:DNA polymerase III subunit delta' [Aidingimonas lacisalsi]|uniref:DNA polymerase III subunit delta' n=1 Tax=Aidingimonas lacisalsi TaxID=2604086 RepID=UPI0011D2310F|nr:DNA polymerase III subunit delta' [Aidingimonas lacisalsi]
MAVDDRAIRLRPLPWQQLPWQRLVDQQNAGRQPHALLLTGPKGVGKQALADALVARTLCHQPEEFACGHCHGCAMLASGYHPDLMRVTPLGSSRQIRIDSVREISDFTHQTAQQGGYRVILIQPAEALNVAAANALLKSLEEPGGRTLFLLLSDVPSRLPATIRSRCQQWRMTIPVRDDCIPWLADRLGDENDARFWLQVAGGLPLLATELADAEARGLRQQLHDVFDALVRGAEPVAEAARLSSQPVESVLWYGIAWLEDLIRLGLSGDSEQVSNPDLLPLYRQAAKNGRVHDWFRLLDFAREQRRLLARGGNPNAQLVLEAWLVRWSSLLRS